MNMVSLAFNNVFRDNASLMMALLVFLAAGTMAFSVMAFARVRGSVKRRASNILDESERSANPKRSLRYSSLRAVAHLIEYTTKHYSTTNDENMKVLRRRMIQAGV
jgi:tight adherence protein C